MVVSAATLQSSARMAAPAGLPSPRGQREAAAMETDRAKREAGVAPAPKTQPPTPPRPSPHVCPGPGSAGRCAACGTECPPRTRRPPWRRAGPGGPRKGCAGSATVGRSVVLMPPRPRRRGRLVALDLAAPGCAPVEYWAGEPPHPSSRPATAAAAAAVGAVLRSALVPDGYPHSVTPDYAAYQAWDSVQARGLWVRCGGGVAVARAGIVVPSTPDGV